MKPIVVNDGVGCSNQEPGVRCNLPDGGNCTRIAQVGADELAPSDHGHGRGRTGQLSRRPVTPQLLVRLQRKKGVELIQGGRQVLSLSHFPQIFRNFGSCNIHQQLWSVKPASPPDRLVTTGSGRLWRNSIYLVFKFQWPGVAREIGNIQRGYKVSTQDIC